MTSRMKRQATGPSLPQILGDEMAELPVVELDTPQSLAALVPAIYLVRDQEQGWPMTALLEILQSQYDALDANVAALYANLFIETCAGWVVPYLGQLVGVAGLDAISAGLPTQRARVANAAAYRQWAGTADALARAAAAASGWPAVAREDVLHALTAASLRHLPPGMTGTANIRDMAGMAQVPTPFNAYRQTLSVRAERTLAGNPLTEAPLPPGLGTVSLAFWRLTAQHLDMAEAKPLGDRLYALHPAGVPMPLFQTPATPDDVVAGLTHAQVPSQILPGQLRQELNAPDAAARLLRLGLHGKNGVNWYAPGQVRVAALAQPRNVPPGLLYVDPLLGRVQLDSGVAEDARLVADYAYGAAGNMGGGPYAREIGLLAEAAGTGLRVMVDSTIAGDHVYQDLKAALKAVRDRAVQDDGVPVVIFINNNERHELPPGFVFPIGGQSVYVVAMNGRRPCISGSMTVTNTSSQSAGALVLDGLLWDGELVIEGAVNLTALDCTIGCANTGRNGFATGIRSQAAKGAAVPEISMTLGNCIVGPCHFPAGPTVLTAADSIIDGGDGQAISGGNPPTIREGGLRLHLDGVTVFGDVAAAVLLEAVNVLVAGRLWSGGRQWAEAPAHSVVTGLAGKAPLSLQWGSRRYGMPAYGLLGSGNPQWVLTAGTGEEAPGALHMLHDRQRERNLAPILAELTVLGDRTRMAFTG